MTHLLIKGIYKKRNKTPCAPNNVPEHKNLMQHFQKRVIVQVLDARRYRRGMKHAYTKKRIHTRIIQQKKRRHPSQKYKILIKHSSQYPPKQSRSKVSHRVGPSILFESSNGLTVLSGICLEETPVASMEGPRLCLAFGGRRPELPGPSISSIATEFVSEKGDLVSENGDPVSMSVIQLLHAD